MGLADGNQKMSLITACPACQTQFEVTDEQLQAYAGKVRCGECDHVFDARSHLVESTAAALAVADTSDVASDAAVYFKVSAEVAASTNQALLAIADEYYDALARFEPIGATENGDNRFDNQLGLSIAPAKRAAQFKLYRQFAQRLQAISREQLTTADRLNYDILQYELNGLIAMERFPEHLLPISQMDSVPVTLANYAGGEASQPIGTVKEYDAYLSRVSQMPAWIDQAIANMKQGMRSGVVQPKAITVAMLPQFQNLRAASPEASVFYSPVTRFPASFSSADKKKLTAAYLNTVDSKVAPALNRLVSFLENE